MQRQAAPSEPAYHPDPYLPLTSQKPQFPSAYSRKSSRLAFRRASYFLTLLAALLFLTLAFNLAFPRFAPRLSNLASQVRPSFSKAKPSTSRPLSNVTMAPARYQHPPQAPPCFNATPQSLLADTKRLIAHNQKVQDDIVRDVKPEGATFENTVLPMARVDDEEALESHVIGFYQAISTDKALRDASTEAEKLMDQFAIDASMREDVYQLVDAALQKKEKLDPESQRLLEKSYKDYVRNGLNIPAGPKRDRFKEIKKRLSDLSITFQKNLNEENGGLWFTPKQLEGVPEDVTSGFDKGEAGTENEGKLRVTFKYPDLFPVQKYAKDAETRQKVFVANENKLNQNVEIFKEAVLLRDEAARLLGYPNHATFKIEDKMAKSPKTVDDFLGDLRTKLTPGGVKEVEKLKELKKSDLASRSDGTAYDNRYYLWDHRFYDTLMLEKEYSLDQQRIAEYFPLQHTILGMLKIFEELFGLEFVQIQGDERDALAKNFSIAKGSDIVWHEDVSLFSVWDSEDQGSNFVGYLYLDLFPRDGKYGHAANFNLQPGFTIPFPGTSTFSIPSTSLTTLSDGSRRRYPATALVCNFSKPTPRKPSLLKHDEVVTLFHELGHGIHDLVGRTAYARFHGTNTVRDFVEAPSQMLENWCWTPSQLRGLSKHYSHVAPSYADEYAEALKAKGEPVELAPEQMPDELIDSIVRTKHVNDALFNLRQLHFGIFDMTVHEPASHADLEAMPVSETYNRLRKEISGLEGPEVLGEGFEWGHGEATFGHLVGGYDAGYYGYLSSQVYSADMFYTAFKADPMNGKEGRRYRHTVLERGGSREEMELLKDFLGREPNQEAFLKELGLSA
ncbi:MAG: hypothetical protein M1822_004960 [Bathelium mastoideum]|nr:MAG: hypothetical protein M1822_004960 [Bathelium mastoideum]